MDEVATERDWHIDSFSIYLLNWGSFLIIHLGQTSLSPIFQLHFFLGDTILSDHNIDQTIIQTISQCNMIPYRTIWSQKIIFRCDLLSIVQLKKFLFYYCWELPQSGPIEQNFELWGCVSISYKSMNFFFSITIIRNSPMRPDVE